MKPQLPKTISQVVARLDAFPQMRQALVFGSLVSSPESAKDVDIAFVHEGASRLDVLERLLPLVQVGAYRTSLYGCLDVFVAFRNVLMVRDDDSVGFTRARNADQIRKAINEQAVEWSKWREGVQLHPEVAPASPLPDNVYFAHPISTYCTPAEDQAIASLEACGMAVVNPSDRPHQEACGNDMVNWAALAASCQGVAFMAFPDGAIGAGVDKEVEAALSQGKPVYEISHRTGAVAPVQSWPGKRALFSVEETRARINPFREDRKAKGLSAIPVREVRTPRAPRP